MTKEKAKNTKSAQFFYKKKMPENLDNSPFLGQFTLGKFVSAVWVLKFGQFTNFFKSNFTLENLQVQFGYINLDNSSIFRANHT